MVQHRSLLSASAIHLRNGLADIARRFKRECVQHRFLDLQELHGTRKIQTAIPRGGLQRDEYADLRSAGHVVWIADVRPGDGHGVLPEAARGAVRIEDAILIVSALLLCLVFANALSARVKTGLDVLVEQDFAPLAGKRVGVIANDNSRSWDGRNLITLLARSKTVKLAAIFAPEHGLAVNAQAGVI